MTFKFILYTYIASIAYLVLLIISGKGLLPFIDYILYTTIYIVCASLYLYHNKKSLSLVLQNTKRKQARIYNLMTLLVIALVIAADRGLFSQPELNWEESRLNSGLLSSFGYVGLALVYARELMSQRNVIILAVSTLLIILCSVITGSRMLIIMLFLFYLQININALGKIKAILLSLCVIPVYFVMRVLRSGDFKLVQSERIDLSSGEFEIFDYVNGARKIADTVDLIQSSIVQNSLIWLGPLRKYICGENVQNLLWTYHYDINFQDMAATYRNLVTSGGSGSHHPLYFYEYQIGSGILGALLSIPFAILLVKIYEIVFNHKYKYANEIDPLLLMAALFFVRGNSVVGFTQLFLGLLLVPILNKLLNVFHQNR